MKKSKYNKLSTSEKGKLGELVTVQKFISRGIHVYMPTSLDDPVDLLAEFGGKLNRIQVKTSSNLTPNGTAIEFSLNHGFRIKNGRIVVKKKSYDMIDYFACYSLINNGLYLIPSKDDHISKAKSIKINIGTKKRESDKRHINYGEDYDFDTMLNSIEE